MTPALKALAVYLSEPCARTFLEDLTWHMQNPTGYVYSTPDCFVMGRYVRRDWPQKDILDPAKFALTGDADCLHIYVAAGDIRHFFNFEHLAVTWVSFERRNNLRFHRYDSLRHRLLQRRRETTGSATPNPDCETSGCDGSG